MLKTKNKNYFQVLIDDINRNTLRGYGAGQSYNEVISRILQHHESAVSIISKCSQCSELFKLAVKEGHGPHQSPEPEPDQTRQTVRPGVNHVFSG